MFVYVLTCSYHIMLHNVCELSETMRAIVCWDTCIAHTGFWKPIIWWHRSWEFTVLPNGVVSCSTPERTPLPSSVPRLSVCVKMPSDHSLNHYLLRLLPRMVYPFTRSLWLERGRACTEDHVLSFNNTRLNMRWSLKIPVVKWGGVLPFQFSTEMNTS